MYWQIMKLDHNKHDLKHFTYDLKVLGKMIGKSDGKVMEHFKEAFPPRIEAHLLEIDETDITVEKQEFLFCCANQNFFNLFCCSNQNFHKL